MNELTLYEDNQCKFTEIDRTLVYHIYLKTEILDMKPDIGIDTITLLRSY